jgi:hypothetical protein
MENVKGSIVIGQLKREAKRLARHTEDSVSIEVQVWYHPVSKRTNFKVDSCTVEMSVWDSRYANRHIVNQRKPEDLRNLTKIIDEIIGSETKKGKMKNG